MKYAIIENGICVNIVMASAEYAEKIGAVPLIEGYGIGDLYSEGEWSHPEPMPDPHPSADVEERLTAVEEDVKSLTEAVERGLAL